MFCSKCGTQTQDGAMFCASCKADLDTQYTKPMMNTHITSEAESFTNAPAFVPVKQTKYSITQKKSKAPLFIGLSIVALVAIIITIVFLLLFKKDDDKKNNSSGNTIADTQIETTIELEKVTEDIISSDTSEFNFSESLAKNHKTVDMPALGSVKQFNGYTLTIPDRWTILENGCYSADEVNTITFSDYKPITPSTKLLVLEEICNAYLKKGVTNMEFGNLIANGKTGYYIEGNYTGSYMCIFFFTNDTDEKLFLTVLVSGHTSVASFDEALGIAASLDIQ